MIAEKFVPLHYESTQDTEVLNSTELHIYHDERDNRTPDTSGSVSDGFGGESCLLDFPTRDKKNRPPYAQASLDDA